MQLTDKQLALAVRTRDHLLEMIEDADGNWIKPWSATLVELMPTNAATGKWFQGSNFVTLAVTSDRRGFSSRWWAGYNQWSELGQRVRKGQSGENGGTLVLIPMTSFSCEPCDWYHAKPCGIPAHTNRTIMRFRSGTVFNYDQTEGSEWQPPDPVTADLRPAEVEAWTAMLGVDVRPGPSIDAYYVPSEDWIRMPLVGQFPEIGEYYSTLFHEIGHWTAHPDRLGRIFNYQIKSERGKEEFTAELAGAMMASLFGTISTSQTAHADYMKYWIRKCEPDAVLSATSDAWKAFLWVQNKAMAGYETVTDSAMVEGAA